MNWKPTNNYAIVSMLTAGQEIQKGIFVPEIVVGEQRWGRVLDVGDGVPDYNAEVHKPEWPKPGQLVYVMNHGRHHIPVWENGQLQYLDVASILDILAIWDEENMKLIPLGQNLEVEAQEAPTQMGGIFIPDSQRPLSGFGKVKAVGKGWRGVNGKPIEFQVKEGDTIAYRPLEIMVIDMRPLGLDETREIVTHGNVLAVFKDEEDGSA